VILHSLSTARAKCPEDSYIRSRGVVEGVWPLCTLRVRSRARSCLLLIAKRLMRNIKLVKVSAPTTLVRVLILGVQGSATAPTELRCSFHWSSRPTSASTSGCCSGSRSRRSSVGSGHSSPPSRAIGTARSPTATASVALSSRSSSAGGT